jgi:hypothetical protein
MHDPRSAPSESAVLTIGDVDLRIDSDSPLVDPPNSPYVFFSSPRVPDAAPDDSPADIEVEVLTTASPANDSPVLFDSGSAWSVQAEGDGYRLGFHRGESGPFHTIACSDADTTHVRVYANQDVAPTEPPVQWITNPVRYPLDQLLLMNHLAPRGGVIVHAAGAVVDGKALVFPGASGAGKSTLSRLFVVAGLGDSLLSDDRVILRWGTPRVASADAGGHERVETWGTPWPGDARIARNASAPLAAVLFLVKADENEMVPLSTGRAMRRLMPVVSCPWYDRERGGLVLDTCARIVEKLPCYDLRFCPDGDVVTLLTKRSWGWDGGQK